jgi:hypothetical protein
VPRPASLLAAYRAWCGATVDPNVVPAHLFPQWAMPLLAEALSDLPYPMTRILNQGCTLRRFAPLPAGEPITTRTHLHKVVETAGKVRIETHLCSGTERQPEAIEAVVHSVVPLRRPAGERRLVRRSGNAAPGAMLALGPINLPRGSGFRYGCLSGDFNPIHWLFPVALAAGFKGTIMQGFGSMALIDERLNAHFGAPPAELDLRFTAPVTLPAQPRLIIAEDAFGDGRILVELRLESGQIAAAGTLLPA